MIHTFKIIGDPVPKQSFRMGKFGGYKSKRVIDAEKDFITQLKEQMGDEEIMEGPISVEVSFYFQRPKKHYVANNRERALKPDMPNRHTQRPDLDNLMKLVKDCMNKIVWVDDSLVAEYVKVQKMYSKQAYTYIEVKNLKDGK